MLIVGSSDMKKKRIILIFGHEDYENFIDTIKQQKNDGNITSSDFEIEQISYVFVSLLFKIFYFFF